jgi:hypothetical protein
MTDNTMAKRRMTENTMTKRRMTDRARIPNSIKKIAKIVGSKNTKQHKQDSQNCWLNRTLN